MNTKKSLILVAALVIIGVGIYLIARPGQDSQLAAVRNVNRNCIRANPTVIVTPTSSTTIASGGSATYQISTKNNDSTKCGQSFFNIIPIKALDSVDPFWGANGAQEIISPGTTRISNVVVTPNMTYYTPGSYTFYYKAVNRDSGGAYYGNSGPVPITITP